MANLTNQRQVFVEEYVRSGDHLEAAKKAGYKDTHTLRNQACKLRRECADEISDELHRNFAEIAPRALNILSDLAENAESESVRLGATRVMENLSDLIHCFTPSELYLTKKRSSLPALVLPSSPS